MAKASKTVKHDIAEQLARENMKDTYFNPATRPLPGAHPEGKINPTVDEKYKKGLRLESIFDPAETRRLRGEIDVITGKSKREVTPAYFFEDQEKL